jgi:YVTN family beta-propeller protein
VTAELSGEVYILDRGTNEIAQVLKFKPPGFQESDVTPVGLILTKDGKTAIITMGRANHVAFVDVATKKIEGYTLVGKRPWGVQLSSDNKLLFVANGLGDDITIIDMDARKAIRSVPVGRIPYGVVIDD